MRLVCPVCEMAQDHRLVEARGRYQIFRCTDCTVEFASPMETSLDDKRIEEIYGSRVEFVGQYIGWFHLEFLKFRPRPHGTLLDMGCGTGDFVELAIRSGYRAIGIDPDSTAIESGKAFHGNVPLFCMTATEFFHRNDTRYNVITFFEVLEHLENPRGFLGEVHRHLAEGGYIALSIPNNDSPLTRLYRKATRIIDYPPHHLTRWSKNALKRLLETCGFDVVKLICLQPTITDIIPDTCMIRLRILDPKTRTRVASILRKMVHPLDKLVAMTLEEGRGMFVLARTRS